MRNIIKSRLLEIQALVNYMEKTTDMCVDDLKVTHHFSDGVYAREIFLPEDTVVIGKIHKTKSLNIISAGCGFVYTALRRFEFEAPYTFESFEGEQKIVYSITDVVWTSIHPTNKNKVEDVEKEVIATNYDNELFKRLEFRGKKWLGLL